jgi:hypothetical protein
LRQPSSAPHGRENADAFTTFQAGVEVRFHSVNEYQFRFIFRDPDVLKQFAKADAGLDWKPVGCFRLELLQRGEKFYLDV